ncbi:MAG TPA: FeoA family protein [candidate division Zixibacteria bacterium]|nr:FeoA family protein [candidate division Zixibacteria bacterium]
MNGSTEIALPNTASSSILRGPLPLALSHAGESFRITRINGSRDLKEHLSALGLTPGVEVVIHCNDRKGPVIVGVKGSRLIIGQDAALKIMIE